MTIVIIACSRRAYELMKKLEQSLSQQAGTTVICKVKCSSLPELSEKCSLTECVGAHFSGADAFVFISAAGIAVRAVAPYLCHKSKDPAVVVLDERGEFCISLLSGHAGGANELTERIAGLSGAVPVITTATDREGKFAVDEFARRNQMAVMDWDMAKRISAGILEGKRIGVYSELSLAGDMPEELFVCDSDFEKTVPETEYVICISYRRLCKKVTNAGSQETAAVSVLQLVPKLLVAGIGCRRGTAKEEIEAALDRCLYDAGIMPEALYAAASIDLKKEEEGLLAFCKDRGLQFFTYSSEELLQVEGEFSASSFVKEVTGVSCVCERSAVLAADGELICRKKIYAGVTVALAARKGFGKF